MAFRFASSFSSIKFNYFMTREYKHIHSLRYVCLCVYMYTHIGPCMFLYNHTCTYISIILYVCIKQKNTYIYIHSRRKRLLKNGSSVFREKAIEEMIIVEKTLTYLPKNWLRPKRFQSLWAATVYELLFKVCAEWLVLPDARFTAWRCLF